MARCHICDYSDDPSGEQSEFHQGLSLVHYGKNKIKRDKASGQLICQECYTTSKSWVVMQPRPKEEGEVETVEKVNDEVDFDPSTLPLR
jgi:hypothetical protein